MFEEPPSGLYDCEFNDGASMSWCNCSNSISCKGDMLHCICGEEWPIFEWSWEKDNTVNDVLLSNENRDVVFHPVYSSGTAAVRGVKQLKQNHHYYWEIKMLTNLYGTDVMVGVGTSKVILSDWRLHFCSMLGYDDESWGYSYTGKIQHGKLTCQYGSRFTVGSLIGIHLDMCAGTLQYYLNRKPLGIAFHGLKNYELYPMVSSTAAQSAMRITCALSEVPTLQIECLKLINTKPALLKQYWSIPGLAKIIDKKYFWLSPKPIKEETSKLELEDEVVLPVNYVDHNFVRRKRFCLGLIHYNFNIPRADPDHINYRQYNATRESCSAERIVIADNAEANPDEDECKSKSTCESESVKSADRLKKDLESSDISDTE